MTESILHLTTRTQSGKQYAKKIRREGKVPGTFYFHGQKSVSFSVEKKDLNAIRGHESGLISALFDGKEDRKCVVREIQYHPVNHSPVHIDLMGIKAGEKIHVSIPLHFSGTPVGVKNEGGILHYIHRDVEIECLPSHLPEFIEIDTTHLGLGDSIVIADIARENIRFINEPDTVLVNVSAPRVVTMIEEEEAGEEVVTEPEVIGKEKEEE
ncbi:50S ribosomal protein L25 [candidate division KSB1 bacterium]|nr:50S ribosomal protein L25 [candidate division KSB1 bacterium]